MEITTESQQGQLNLSPSIATQNSAVAYGLGSFGLESLFQVFAGFYVFYYTDKLGLAVTMAAIINIVYGSWDAVDDPIVGFLSDNTRTRWGRRRPWLLIGLPAGNYMVIANGVSASFTLPLENPTSTLQPTVIAPPTSSVCIDSAAFVGDVTVLDNSVLAPNTAFTKTWRIKNTGTCTWNSSYLVAYISGATMSQQPGYWILPQGQTIKPDETVDINVGMTSPVENGIYVSYWGLKKENGQLIPVRGGVNYRSFYVKIKVNNGNTTAGSITAASIDIEPKQGSGAAGSADATYFTHAYITADGPTTASYEINSTAGQIAAGNFQSSPTRPVWPVVTGTLAFDQAGTQTINLRFVGPYPNPGDITVNLRVNGGEWHNTKLPCP